MSYDKLSPIGQAFVDRHNDRRDQAIEFAWAIEHQYDETEGDDIWEPSDHWTETGMTDAEWDSDFDAYCKA